MLMFKFTVASEWHKPFDDRHWFHLLDMQMLKWVDEYVRAVLHGGKAHLVRLECCLSMNRYITYSIVNYSNINIQPSCSGNSEWWWITPSYGPQKWIQKASCERKKFINILTQHVHLSLTILHLHYTVINACPKCNWSKIDQLVLEQYEEETDKSQEFWQWLILLCDIWTLFVGAKSASKAWRKKSQADKSEGDKSEVSKRKRE